MEYNEIGERFEYKGVVLEVTTPGYCSVATFYVDVDAVWY